MGSVLQEFSASSAGTLWVRLGLGVERSVHRGTKILFVGCIGPGQRACVNATEILLIVLWAVSARCREFYPR